MATRIVVTGASGNVGTAVLRALAGAAEDYDVVGVVRRPPPWRGPYRDVEWHAVDLAAAGADRRLTGVCEGADCVVHLAWAFQPTRNVDYLYRVGVGGTTALVEAAHRAGVPHFVHMSSVGTYAAGRYGRRVDETWSTAGIATSVYSRTKAAAEAMLDDYEAGRHGAMAITRLRPGLIVQRDAASALRRYVLPAFLPPRLVGLLPVLPLDRSFAVPFVHADDVADAVVRAVRGRHAGAYNLAAEPPVRPAQLGRLINARPVHVPSALLQPAVQASWRLGLQPIDQGWLDLAFSVPLLDTAKAREQLGWAPRWTSLDALADLGAGFTDEPESVSPVLRSRLVREQLDRDVRVGPLTLREVP